MAQAEVSFKCQTAAASATAMAATSPMPPCLADVAKLPGTEEATGTCGPHGLRRRSRLDRGAATQVPQTSCPQTSHTACTSPASPGPLHPAHPDTPPLDVWPQAETPRSQPQKIPRRLRHATAPHPTSIHQTRVPMPRTLPSAAP
jgi:hypothetical protein